MAMDISCRKWRLSQRMWKMTSFAPHCGQHQYAIWSFCVFNTQCKPCTYLLRHPMHYSWYFFILSQIFSRNFFLEPLLGTALCSEVKCLSSSNASLTRWGMLRHDIIWFRSDWEKLDSVSEWQFFGNHIPVRWISPLWTRAQCLHEIPGNSFDSAGSIPLRFNVLALRWHGLTCFQRRKVRPETVEKSCG